MYQSSSTAVLSLHICTCCRFALFICRYSLIAIIWFSSAQFYMIEIVIISFPTWMAVTRQNIWRIVRHTSGKIEKDLGGVGAWEELLTGRDTSESGLTIETAACGGQCQMVESSKTRRPQRVFKDFAKRCLKMTMQQAYTAESLRQSRLQAYTTESLRQSWLHSNNKSGRYFLQNEGRKVTIRHIRGKVTIRF